MNSFKISIFFFLIFASSGYSQVKNLIAKEITHRVLTKETIFGIAKKYGISDVALKKANPELEELGLQIGQNLVIPNPVLHKKGAAKTNEIVYHEVLSKETKYSIAKKYNTTVEELEINNPEIVANLTEGFKLIVKGKPEIVTKIVVPETKIEMPKVASNPVIVNRVYEVKKNYSKLFVNNNGNQRKKLALLLPFNFNKIESDSTNSTASRLKKDKFLNMTLDFYAGALMAIDSAKTLGIHVDISIFDSQETKNSSNIDAIHSQNNLENSDAIIGPFYQNNVEKMATLVNDVAVISPLSKDVGNSYDNLYQSIPNTDAIKKSVFEFMLEKQGNIIAVVDRKKESAKNFVMQNYPEVKMVALQENGSLSSINLKNLFEKGKTNYVVLASENTGMIKTVMATLLAAMATYSVQLVLFEPNETLETDEINFENLTKLKLMYPSINRENNSVEAQIFKKEFRKKNKIYPNTFATRGFDVTFDTMMRLAQGKSFDKTAETFATEQIENRFEYYKKEAGGFANKGIFIVHYDTDLSIKVAN